MGAAIFAVVLLTVSLTVQSAPADLDTYINERQEIPQEEPGKNMPASHALRSYAPWAACKNELMKLVQEAKVCRRFLTPAAQKFAKHARENIQFNNEIVTAGKELADGEIDTKGDPPEEKKVERAEKMAANLTYRGYIYRVNPHGSKGDVMLPFEAYKKDTPPECKTLITGFLERNSHAGRSD
ncbi:uncharacterized protein [Pocillopora verrucosa]|uniref:uncharacterized protein isoform X1 n=1 Tax=Pocillopora verrucosa TaxID=203993 RepID=UPI002797177E|nr:uncharacterized protein LOC131776493 isoform X1 [Pocillopora verrucosa]